MASGCVTRMGDGRTGHTELLLLLGLRGTWMLGRRPLDTGLHEVLPALHWRCCMASQWTPPSNSDGTVLPWTDSCKSAAILGLWRPIGPRILT